MTIGTIQQVVCVFYTALFQLLSISIGIIEAYSDRFWNLLTRIWQHLKENLKLIFYDFKACSVFACIFSSLRFNEVGNYTQK